MKNGLSIQSPKRLLNKVGPRTADMCLAPYDAAQNVGSSSRIILFEGGEGINASLWPRLDVRIHPSQWSRCAMWSTRFLRTNDLPLVPPSSWCASITVSKGLLVEQQFFVATVSCRISFQSIVALLPSLLTRHCPIPAYNDIVVTSSTLLCLGN
jgi:hypothetical protein